VAKYETMHPSVPAVSPFVLRYCAENTQNLIDISENINGISKNLSGISENINDILTSVCASSDSSPHCG